MDNHQNDSNLLYDYGLSQAETQHVATKEAFQKSNHFQPNTQSDLFGVFDDNQAFQDWINNLDVTAVSCQLVPNEQYL